MTGILQELPRTEILNNMFLLPWIVISGNSWIIVLLVLFAVIDPEKVCTYVLLFDSAPDSPAI
jgi:hypothetical protein